MVWLEASGVWARMPEHHEQDNSHDSKISAEDRPKFASPSKESRDEDCDGAHTCSICLDGVDLKDKAVLKNCMHEYHYDCISQWLAQKGQCPLCKANVVSVIHRIKSDGTYQEKELPAPISLPDPHRTEIMARLAEILGVAGLLRDELYALRSGNRGWNQSSHHRQNRNQHSHASNSNERSVNPTQYSLRVQHHAHATTREGTATHHATTERPLRNTITTGNRLSSVDIWGAEGNDKALITEEERLIQWRRDVYAHNVWAVPLGSHPQPPTSLGAPVGRQRRVSQWVDRELQALLETRDTVVVRGFIMGLIATYGILVPERPSRRHFDSQLGNNSYRGNHSQNGERDPVALLRPFLGDRAAHFWHELACFVTAPAYTIETYDRILRYDVPPGGDQGRHATQRGFLDERRNKRSDRSSSYKSQSRSRRRIERSRSRHRSRSRLPSKQQGGRVSENNDFRDDRDEEYGDRWRMWQLGDPI